MDQPAAARYVDLASWSRRGAFDYFRAFDKPYFNVCTRVDVARLKAAVVAAHGGGSFAFALHFVALRLANAMEPFRLRLEGGGRDDPGHEGGHETGAGTPRVRIHERVQGGATVLRDDGSFGFAYFDDAPDFAAFRGPAAAAWAAARAPQAGFHPRVDHAPVIHFTTLPWVHFTSFSHARNWGREDSVPKVSFGRADGDGDGERLWLPLSVEVHHALMDGLHVGRYVEAFEAAARDPQPFLEGR